jgi:MFS transporter, FSR family, fosmidomycin resistance protein
MMLLPPLLVLVKDSLGVGYVEIGAAIGAFGLCSALLQAPAGLVVDRLGPRVVLVGGLLLGSAAIVAAALAQAYWSFVVAYALLGVANTAYHPSDYSILAAAVDIRRLGRAFSVHTFAGYLGFAVTPMATLAVAALWGWRGAFLLAAGLSLAVALLLVVAGRGLPRGRRPAASEERKGRPTLGLLFSAPVLGCLLFFFCIAMANTGVQTFTVAGLGALHGTPAPSANVALSGYLLFSAAGVLVGGLIADRTPRHERTAAVALACTSAMAILVAWADMPGSVLVFVMALGGLMNGVMYPSRDLMVRAASPAEAFGTVFGFVSTGLYLGGMTSPLLYGWLMDEGEPRVTFLVVAAFMVLALVTVLLRPRAIHSCG